jgi:general stress protein 26
MNHVVLATTEDDQPRLRPITLVMHKEAFYFATQTSDNKVKQLNRNPKVELILQWSEQPNNGYIRVEGAVSKITLKPLITELFNTYDFMEKLWTGPDDPNLTIYEVKPKVYDYLPTGAWSTQRIEK